MPAQLNNEIQIGTAARASGIAHAPSSMGCKTTGAVVNVLLVEDTLSDAELLQFALRKNAEPRFSITHVETWAEAAATLGQKQFDVLLLDLNLPDTSGTRTFIRARAEAPRLPIVILTGNEDEALAMEAARHGVEDYIVKSPNEVRHVVRSIRYAVERARAKAKLSDYEALIRTIVESINDPVFAKDLQGRYLLVNAATSTAFGKRTSDFVDHDDTHVMGQSDAAAVMRADQQILSTGMTNTFEETLTVGQERKVYTTTKGPLRDGAGKVIGIYGISHDVTKTKQHERHLQGLASLLQLFTKGYSRKDYYEAVVHTLKEWCGCQCVGVRLLTESHQLPFTAQVGFDQEFLREEDKLCVVEGGCACVRVLLARHQPAEGSCKAEGGALFCNHASACISQLGPERSNGHPIACLKAGYESLAHLPLRYRGHLIGSLHLADPGPDKFTPESIAFLEAAALAVAEAIHQLQTEESLVESEARFRSMFERHASVMLLADPKTGAVVDANPAAASFYGYSQEKLCSLKLQDLSSEPNGEGKPPQLSEHRSFWVLMHRLANGQKRLVEAHASPFQTHGRKLLFIILHDITERTQLQKQVLEIGEKERQRVGQDLHDSLGGKLAGAALMGKALGRKLASINLPEAELAQEVVECINDAIRQTRSIARGLWPAELTGAGLSEALTEFATETQRRSGIQCKLDADKDFKVDQRFIALNLFRFALEAVNNAVRHANARHITISLRKESSYTKLEVRDDGKGMPHRMPASVGLGLRTMRYRAESIGGRLMISPGPTGGTIVSCLLPADLVAKPHYHI